MTRWVPRVGRAADWTQRARIRLPRVDAQGHPPWVGEAVSDAVPAAALLLVGWVLSRAHSAWLTHAVAGVLVAYVVLCYLFPWFVAIGRNFVSGYRTG